MSRYVRVTMQFASLDEVAAALTRATVAFERDAAGLMLAGSLECAGEPVQIRCRAGVSNAVEDFGFVLEDGAVQLVCGDVDRRVLEHGVVREMAAAVAAARAEAAGLDAVIEDGGRRVVVRRK